jgi:hypothetical protein
MSLDFTAAACQTTDKARMPNLAKLALLAATGILAGALYLNTSGDARRAAGASISAPSISPAELMSGVGRLPETYVCDYF